MNKPESIKGKARELLLDTAEQLFAEQGVEAISLRAINAAAGVSPSVLHYHFGNREALVSAVIERRMPLLMEQRQARLKPLLETNTPGLKAIIEALVLPLADFVLTDTEAGQGYIRFIARLYADRSPILDKLSQQYIRPTTRHFPKLIANACPQLSIDAINSRLNMANHTSLQTLAGIKAAPRPWQRQRANDTQQQIDELVNFITGGFQKTTDTAEKDTQ